MNEPLPETGEQRLRAYLARLAEVLGHADRNERMVGCCTGLLLPGERKSVEPMAARLDPARVSSLHQALHHFVATAPWSDAAVLAAVREQVLPALSRHGPVTAWIIDDTGFPKKGKHSVGVARQYCGQLGKQENCRVAGSLSVANERATLPVAFELYLPEGWAGDPARRAEAGVPPDLTFRTKPRIALGQIRRALADGVPPGVVLGDAGYGIDTDFRTASTALALPYVLGVQSTVGVWPPGHGPLSPKPWSGRGRPPELPPRAGRGAPPRAAAPGGRAPAGHRQGPRLRLAAECLADGGLARGGPGRAERPLRGRAGAAVAPRLLARRPAPGGVAADRAAGGEGGADQVLALHPGRDGRARGAGRDRQDALADRAGLPGAQAGAGARPLRGPLLARAAPPRHLVHRGLRLPRSRAEPFPPPGPLPGASPGATRGLAAPRASRADPSVTSRARSPRYGAASRSPWSAACHAAPAASCPPDRGLLSREPAIYNTVRLITFIGDVV